MKQSLRIAAFALGALLTLAGCQTVNRVPRYDMRTGEPRQYRRYGDRNDRGFLGLGGQTAYEKVTQQVRTPLSDDMKSVLDRHGEPEYHRGPFPAETDELVDEWVYWDRNVICQFVQRQLVFEGELTDQDRWLVQYGFPSAAQDQTTEAGYRREIWIYRNLLGTDIVEVSFTDGKMIGMTNF